MSDLTQVELKRQLHYDPATGVFTWLVKKKRCSIGQQAGVVHDDGYRVVSINSRIYLSGRLAWLYMTGQWPKHQVDHKDTDGTNDAWVNLREATPQQNAANRKVRSDNQLGIKGVTKKENGRYQARIGSGGKSLGTFSTIEEAKAAYAKAALLRFGEFARL